MKSAVISLAGTQFNIAENDVIQIPGNSAITPVVLTYTDGKKTHVGTPSVKDIVVKFETIDDSAYQKTPVKRFKAKSRYRKTVGHKQPLIVLKVKEISEKAEKVEKAEKAEK